MSRPPLCELKYIKEKGEASTDVAWDILLDDVESIATAGTASEWGFIVLF